MFPIESFHTPCSLEEALALVQNPSCQALAGGTDILVKLRETLQAAHLVDISALPELCGQSLSSSGLIRLGANTTFTDLVRSPLVATHIPVLAEAADQVAGPQIRNVATLGGNLCNGAVSADSAAPLLILNAQLHLQSASGQRRLPLAAWFKGPGKVALLPGELLLAIEIEPAAYTHFGAAYHKYAQRAAMDIATIGCAAGLRLGTSGPEQGCISEVRLAYTVAAPTPLRCPQAEAAALSVATGKVPTPDLLKRMVAAMAEAVQADVQPRTSWRAGKEFRLHIIQTLAQRVTLLAFERAQHLSAVKHS